MRINNSEVNFIVTKSQNIRKKAFDFEDFLDDFKEPFIVPLPDNFSPDAPRIIFQTPHGHSTLTISQTNFSLKTGYDNGWEYDIEKCLDYIRNRAESIYTMVTENDITIFYIGIIFDYYVPIENSNQSMRILSEKFLNQNLNLNGISRKDITDLNLKLTTEINSKFYRNFHFNTYKSYESREATNQSLANFDIREEGIRIRIDVNDRKAFNIDGNHRSDLDVFREMIEITFDNYNKLPDMLE